jgi:hypothetical protein
MPRTAEQEREYNARKREKLKAAGKCLRCGSKPAAVRHGRTLIRCDKCKSIHYKSQRRFRAIQQLRKALDRKENTLPLFALKRFIEQSIKDGVSEDTLLNVSHDRYLDLGVIFARKR